MKKLLYSIFILIALTAGKAYSQQKKWTLEDCINYAITNNINLQRQQLLTESAELNYFKSKMDVLPVVNAGTNANMGFGRSVSSVTNLITFNQNLGNEYAINSSVNLFNGLATFNTLLANRFLLKAGVESEKVVRNTLVVEIMGQYYQVLYTKGLEEASRLQLEQSEKQLFRITKMVETGREALSKQYEMESRASADKLSFTIAQTKASQALTTLKQMLQLQPGTEFDVLMPEMNTLVITDADYETDSIYSIAAQVLPRLKSIEFELQANKRQYAAAKGLISPRLSVGGSIYTGYYKMMNETTEEQASFQTQLKNNNSQAIWMSLSIPLFNNYNTGKNIKMAKLKRDDTELRLELEKNTLYTEIENACLDFNSGRDEFEAAASNLEFNKKSFSAVEKKFESGLVDVTDYSAAKTTLFNAETELLRTKLQVIIRKLTIQLYSTGDYQNLIYN
ncbi:MAG TPA: TolC family protein [Bacteroidales bacterium]|nr:TolC family protein [Bacteroidales bacterium]